MYEVEYALVPLHLLGQTLLYIWAGLHNFTFPTLSTSILEQLSSACSNCNCSR